MTTLRVRLSSQLVAVVSIIPSLHLLWMNLPYLTLCRSKGDRVSVSRHAGGSQHLSFRWRLQLPLHPESLDHDVHHTSAALCASPGQTLAVASPPQAGLRTLRRSCPVARSLFACLAVQTELLPKNHHHTCTGSRRYHKLYGKIITFRSKDLLRVSHDQVRRHGPATATATAARGEVDECQDGAR